MQNNIEPIIIFIIILIQLLAMGVTKRPKKADQIAYDKFVVAMKDEPKPIRKPEQSDDDWEREQLIDDLVKKRLELEHLNRQLLISKISIAIQVIMTTIAVGVFVLDTLYQKGYINL